MKLRLYYILTCIFLLSCAMQCGCEGDYDYYSSPSCKLTQVEIQNVNNEGKNPFISDDSIRKEAYAIKIVYKGTSLLDTTTIIPIKAVDIGNVKSRKFFCNTSFDDLHPANTDVTDYFEAIIVKDPYLEPDIYLLRKTPKAGLHSFRVEFLLEDGNTLIANTNPIMLY